MLEIVAYFFLVIVTLTFDLVFIKKNMYKAYLLYYMTKNSPVWYVYSSFGSYMPPFVFRVSVNLSPGFSSR